MEPISDYHADNSRSDLSDILEEEEEDLYSDHLSEKQGRGYRFEANRVKKLCFAVICPVCDVSAASFHSLENH